jgi:hypothetical protein
VPSGVLKQSPGARVLSRSKARCSIAAMKRSQIARVLMKSGSLEDTLAYDFWREVAIDLHIRGHGRTKRGKKVAKLLLWFFSLSPHHPTSGRPVRVPALSPGIATLLRR